MKHRLFSHQTCTTAQVPGQEQSRGGASLQGKGSEQALSAVSSTRADSPGSELWAQACCGDAKGAGFWAPQCKRGMELLERATELTKGLEHPFHEGAGPAQTTEMGPINVSKSLQGGCQKDGSRLFVGAASQGNRTRGKGQEPVHRSST